jgi:hypothetical protein
MRTAHHEAGRSVMGTDLLSRESECSATRAKPTSASPRRLLNKVSVEWVWWSWAEGGQGR